MRRITTRPLSIIATALLLALCGPAAAQDEFGTIKGQVVWGGDEAPELPPKVAEGENVKDAQVCAAEPVPDESLVVDEETKGVQHCLVYLVEPSGENPEAASQLLERQPEVAIDQKGCRFIPHVAAAHEDQKVVFNSSDPVGHNVNIKGFDNSANFMLQPQGSQAQEMIAGRFPSQVGCDIHPWMSGWIMVLDHPYFAVTDEQGNFEITGVPAGTQNLVIWQESVGYVTPNRTRGFEIPIEAGKVSKVGPVVIEPERVKSN